MELKTTITQHIRASADKVWAVVTDVPGSAATLTAVESVQLLTEGPYAKGTRWKETRTLLGRSETLEMWVSRCEPPAGDRSGGPAGSTTVQARQNGTDYTSRFSIAERDGGTDLTLTFAAARVGSGRVGSARVGSGRLGKALMTVFGPLGMRITRKGLARDLAEIAARAEAQ
ncbi:SRPBCC family protein [Arthrobacter sp. UYEF3]|uniref:SRPBCC family protein n=1 Tax=Arthrobacter sp. UYEF3 TaxID=1756365 RepID=UPI0033968153